MSFSCFWKPFNVYRLYCVIYTLTQVLILMSFSEEQWEERKVLYRMLNTDFFLRFHCCVFACSLGISTRQLSQDGCAGFLNQSNKRLASTSLLHAASWKRKWQTGGSGGRVGDERLKQEMTSVPSAEQLATLRNGIWGRRERVRQFTILSLPWSDLLILLCVNYNKPYQKNIEEHEKTQWWKWAKRNTYSLNFISVWAIFVP